MFFSGIILLAYKGIILNYFLNLQVDSNATLYTIAASILIMCPIVNKKNKSAYIYKRNLFSSNIYYIFQLFLL